MTAALRVVEPGLLTTVQDLGRYGYQRFGVPVSGAMDDFALRAANLMVGNQEGAAALELTVLGPTIVFESDTRIAITGGDLGPALDGEPVPLWETVNVPTGGSLSFGGARDGLRSWLAVAGGIDVPRRHEEPFDIRAWRNRRTERTCSHSWRYPVDPQSLWRLRRNQTPARRLPGTLIWQQPSSPGRPRPAARRLHGRCRLDTSRIDILRVDGPGPHGMQAGGSHP